MEPIGGPTRVLVEDVFLEERLVDRRQPNVTESGLGSFGDFFEEWREPIRRSLALAVGDLTLAEEAVDEAMTRALASWHKIGSYEKPEGWVYRVGLNWSRGVFRKCQYEIVSRLNPDSKSTVAGFPDVDVIEAVRDLSARLRAVVVARYYLDWSTQEVADALNIPEGTVKSRLSRALKRLARVLEVKP